MKESTICFCFGWHQCPRCNWYNRKHWTIPRFLASSHICLLELGWLRDNWCYSCGESRPRAMGDYAPCFEKAFHTNNSAIHTCYFRRQSQCADGRRTAGGHLHGFSRIGPALDLCPRSSAKPSHRLAFVLQHLLHILRSDLCCECCLHLFATTPCFGINPRSMATLGAENKETVGTDFFAWHTTGHCRYILAVWLACVSGR